MRTTIILRDDLVTRAMKETGIQEKTKLIHMGLEALIEKSARQRLINLLGTMKKAEAPHRRKVGHR